MLAMFSPIFMADTKAIFDNNFVAPFKGTLMQISKSPYMFVFM